MAMNLLQKIAYVRLEFQNAKVKMTGNNKYAGYSYYELCDILPILNKLCGDIGILPVCCFEEGRATLTILDCESENTIVFTSPMSSASLKGCHEVQNLGAVETYLKRYLYQNAFEIVESDVLNGQQGKEEKKQALQPKKEYNCAVCGQEFTAFTSAKGKTYTAPQMYHMSENKNGKALCMDCSKKAKEGEKTNE